MTVLWINECAYFFSGSMILRCLCQRGHSRLVNAPAVLFVVTALLPVSLLLCMRCVINYVDFTTTAIWSVSLLLCFVISWPLLPKAFPRDPSASLEDWHKLARAGEKCWFYNGRDKKTSKMFEKCSFWTGRTGSFWILAKALQCCPIHHRLCLCCVVSLLSTVSPMLPSLSPLLCFHRCHHPLSVSPLFSLLSPDSVTTTVISVISCQCHSSRQAWQTFNRLTGRAKMTPPCPVSANAIASKLIKNGRHRNVDKLVGSDVNAEIATLRGSGTTGDNSLTETFTEAEMLTAVSHLKSGKAQGPDHIAPEFIINFGMLMLNWLREFFSQCMHSLRLPKVWRRADIIAVLKPNKSADDAKNYRPISLLCVPLKLLERLLLSRLDPVIDPQLPPEQAGFRHGRSTTDQVKFLADDIEVGFEHNHKVGVALVDLTAAYDTGYVVSIWSFCACYLTGIWSRLRWNSSPTEGSH